MAGRIRFGLLSVTILILCGVAGTAFSMPAGVPKGKGLGLGKGKGLGLGFGVALAKVSYSCIGFAEEVNDRGSALAAVADEVELQMGGSTVFLDGSAGGEQAGDGLSEPQQWASAGVESPRLSLRPFDHCDSSADSVLVSTVTGAHVTDSTASGVADVVFRVHFDAILELGGSEAFTAYTGTELEVVGISLDSFEVSASGEIVSAPEGLTVTKTVSGDQVVYEVSGTHEIPTQLPYGEGVINVVEMTSFAGGQVEAAQQAASVSGLAGAGVPDSIRYEVLSLDPNVEFQFEEVPDAGTGAPAQ